MSLPNNIKPIYKNTQFSFSVNFHDKKGWVNFGLVESVFLIQYLGYADFILHDMMNNAGVIYDIDDVSMVYNRKATNS